MMGTLILHWVGALFGTLVPLAAWILNLIRNIDIRITHESAEDSDRGAKALGGGTNVLAILLRRVKDDFIAILTVPIPL